MLWNILSEYNSRADIQPNMKNVQITCMYFDIENADE